MNSTIVINLICINAEGKLLLVCKKGVWILPGGKHQGVETDEECLRREFLEEISAIARVGEYLGFIRGISPHSKTNVVVRIYLGEVSGDIVPRNEISDARFFSASELSELHLSDVTRSIVPKFIPAGLLR